MHQNPSITVLLSSYNGEKYIQQQIESILSQRNVQPTLLIRDDGSTDSTRTILEALTIENSNVRPVFGNNVGVKKSFFELMQMVETKTDFYAFADQDDVWYPDKLGMAMAMCRDQNPDVPVMYCSALEYVNDKLEHIKNSPRLDQAKIGFGNALVENMATGCTMVINESARAKIVKNLPQQCLMHDWWIYLVVSAFGSVIYDPDPSIKYRQHGTNQIGVAITVTDKLKRLYRSLRIKPAISVSTQLNEFEKIYGNELSQQKKLTLNRLLDAETSFFSRIKIVIYRDFWRQTKMDQLFLHLVILFGRL